MESSSRPNPDELLNRIKRQEAKLKKGRLKIYFGMSAGVGKTFAMLQDAAKEARAGRNVLIGYVETHGRKETEALLEGLTVLERKKILYNNITLEEMDIDAILAQKPELVIVDELAHTNAPTSRHKKRYLDVLEILDNGISVYTTVNVQHLESRADTVAQISGIIVRETVPDSILEAADEIELVDISPEELLDRLREGKVYKGEQSKKALESFFKKGNLTALREMALRLTADRVDKQLRDYMQEERIPGPWKSGLRILIAIGPGPYSAQLIKWARNIAYTMEASWLAVYVDTSVPLKDEEKVSLKKNFDLARGLGADIITTSDSDIVNALLRTARHENATQIIVGKPVNDSFFTRLFGKTIVDRLIHESGNIDILVIGGKPERGGKISLTSYFQRQSGWIKYLFTTSIVSLVALTCFPLRDMIGYQTTGLILLLTVALLPLKFGPGPVLLSAAASAVIWNFFFIPPILTFNIAKTEDILMFAMYFIIAAITSILTTRIRAREKAVRQREERAVALYNLANDLSSSHALDIVIESGIKNITSVFRCDAALLLADSRGILFNTYPPSGKYILNKKEFSVASWVYLNSKNAGRFTDTLPDSEAQYYPLTSPRKTLGVIGVKYKETAKPEIEQETLLENFIRQIGVAVEREQLNEAAKRSMMVETSEKLYKNLFNSISHELRTPISAIMGSAEILRKGKAEIDSKMRTQLNEGIYDAAKRLNRLVENLLDMTRLETGRMELNLNWHDIRDLVSIVLENLNKELKGHKISMSIPNDMPLIKVDFVLMEQVLKNVFHNASIHTQPNSEILLHCNFDKENCYITISDNGAGVPEEKLQHLFDKFYRADGKTGGTGLGLSIAKGFIEAHRGSIKAQNQSNGGLKFEIQLPQNFSELRKEKVEQ